MNHLPLFREPPLKPPNAPDIRERTIRRWTLSGKLPATKHGSQFKIALADLEPLLDARLYGLLTSSVGGSSHIVGKDEF